MYIVRRWGAPRVDLEGEANKYRRDWTKKTDLQLVCVEEIFLKGVVPYLATLALFFFGVQPSIWVCNYSGGGALLGLRKRAIGILQLMGRDRRERREGQRRRRRTFRLRAGLRTCGGHGKRERCTNDWEPDDIYGAR